MGEIEVRAAMPMSVDVLGGMVRKNQYLRADGDDPRIQALISAGYLKITDMLEGSDAADSVDHAGLSGLPSGSVDSSVEGPKKRGRPKKALAEAGGADGPESSGNEDVGEVAQQTG